MRSLVDQAGDVSQGPQGEGEETKTFVLCGRLNQNCRLKAASRSLDFQAKNVVSLEVFVVLFC